jgi:hypothetical protein
MQLMPSLPRRCTITSDVATTLHDELHESSQRRAEKIGDETLTPSASAVVFSRWRSDVPL